MNLFFPALLLGLVTSVHCVAMCGGMVLTYAVKGSEDETSTLKRMWPHFAYQGAKIASYTFVGLLLGAIGSAFDLGGVRGWVTLLAGAFMILLGLNMTGRFPALRHLTPRPPKFLMTILMKLRRKANADADAGAPSLMTPIMFGLMTGFMPCGPLQTAQVAAAGAGSPFYGAISMLGFGLGTAPLMLGFGAASSMLTDRFKKVVASVSVVLVIGLGLVMLNRGLMVVGSPVTFDALKRSVAASVVPQPQTAEQTYPTGADGVVEVPLVIENVQFQPQNLSIPADKPVRIVVDRREDNPCSAQLALPQLNVMVNLTPNGKTVIDLPATKAGTYTLTCGMGMMSGSLTVGGGAASSGSSPVVPLLLLAAAGTAGYAVYSMRRRAAAEAAAAKDRSHGRKGASAPQPKAKLILGTFTYTEGALVLLAASAAIVVGYLAAGVL